MTRAIISVLILAAAVIVINKWVNENGIGDFVPEGAEYLMESSGTEGETGTFTLKIKKDGAEVAEWTSGCGYDIKSQDPEAFGEVFDSIFLKESCLSKSGENLTGWVECRNYNGAVAIGFGVKDNLLNGTFKVVAPGDKVIFKARYEDGKLTGPFVAMDFGGSCVKAKGSFVDGKLDGKYVRNICHTAIGDYEADIEREYDNGTVLKEVSLKKAE